MRNFGPLSAESDASILEYFHQTDQIKALIDFSKPRSAFMLIARPGSGKTAVRRWLQTGTTADLAIVLTSDKIRLYLKDEPESNAGDLRLLITNDLFVALVSEAIEQKIVPPKLQTEADRLVSKGWGLLGEFLTEKLAGISIMGSGVSLKPADRQRYLQKIRQSDRLDDLAAFLKKLGDNRRILLVVDNPEEIVGNGLDDLTVENSVRVGSFLSVLSRVNSAGIRVVCFIKEQLVQSVRSHYNDFQHFADQFESLGWTSDDLIQMLENRIKKRFKTSWDQVFQLDKGVMEREVLPMLSNGPRDLIFLCNIAGNRNDQIPLDELLSNVRYLRSDRMKDFSSQYKQWPQFERVVGSLVSALENEYKTGVIPVGGINKVFANLYSKPGSDIHNLRKIEWVDRAKWDAPHIDERLFVAGVVGYRKGGTAIFPWAGRDIAGFQAADSHFISPLYSEIKIAQDGKQAKKK